MARRRCADRRPCRRLGGRSSRLPAKVGVGVTARKLLLKRARMLSVNEKCYEIKAIVGLAFDQEREQTARKAREADAAARAEVLRRRAMARMAAREAERARRSPAAAAAAVLQEAVRRGGPALAMAQRRRRCERWCPGGAGGHRARPVRRDGGGWEAARGGGM